jgi:hypothetical protein
MFIRVRVWRMLTSAERMALLSHVSEQNRRRWQKRKAAC